MVGGAYATQPFRRLAQKSWFHCPSGAETSNSGSVEEFSVVTVSRDENLEISHQILSWNIANNKYAPIDCNPLVQFPVTKQDSRVNYVCGPAMGQAPHLGNLDSILGHIRELLWKHLHIAGFIRAWVFLVQTIPLSTVTYSSPGFRVYCCWPSSVQSLLFPDPVGPTVILLCVSIFAVTE